MSTEQEGVPKEQEQEEIPKLVTYNGNQWYVAAFTPTFAGGVPIMYPKMDWMTEEESHMLDKISEIHIDKEVTTAATSTYIITIKEKSGGVMAQLRLPMDKYCVVFSNHLSDEEAEQLV